jgi:pyruvate dehydrogenase E1 component alpha subunit
VEWDKSQEELIELYRQMLLIRRFEERVVELFMKGEVVGMLHLYIGEEAVAVGACSALKKQDYITSTHRGHGHCIARGADIKLMMAELFGRVTGYCRGKGGSMHIADINLGHLGANGIVGGGLTIATGAALASQVKGTDQIVICFFGDGALNTGEIHESFNLANLWNLPVVFICENNQYAISTSVKRACCIEDIARRAEAYNMPGVTADGMDALAVRKEALIAIKHARSGEGPTFIVCQTYRFLGHSRSDSCPYRTKEEEAEWKARCPVNNFRERLIRDGVISSGEIKALETDIAGQIEEAVEFARESPYPQAADLETDLYA